MTPNELETYLGVLRASGVISARLLINATDISVTFGPDAMPNPPGFELTPGGWKGPQGLDADPFDFQVTK